MSDKNRKAHWEKVYATKEAHEVSWTQELPATSLHFIHEFNLKHEDAIIDIGGGDSKFVDYLLEEGYTNISVLDISKHAIEKAKSRLGEKAKQVHWIISDINDFEPQQYYCCWHDRATFHFLNEVHEIEHYLGIARKAVRGYMAMGTFSDKGPDRCSMLKVHRYTENELAAQLSNGFEKIHCVTEDHITPFQTVQNFLFCSFKRSA